MGFKSGTSTGVVKIAEQADAESDTGGVGQIWVKSNAPCDLFFTDDTGQDVRITNDGSLAAAPGSSVAADDINAGDAAVLITTDTGNITIDAAANNTDIIFKGTDGGADTTFLTLDGSEKGAAAFNDAISGAAALSAHSLAIQDGAVVTGSSVNHGPLTLQGTLSSSGGVVVLGGIIANTIEVSSSIMTAGALTVTSSISGAAALSAHSLAIQDGAIVTGSSINHGSLTLHGVLSSSANITLPSDSYLSSSGGATFLQGIIANTLEASSSIQTAGTLEASSSISGAAAIEGHSLAIQDGATVTGSTILHGPVSCSQGATFTQGLITVRTIEATGSIVTQGSLAVSGSTVLGDATTDTINITGSTTQHGPYSSSFGGTFVQGLITVRTLEATGSVTTQGDLNTSGALNVAAAGTVVGPLTTRDDLNVSGSTVLGNAAADTINITGSTKVHGPISSSYGATFLGGIQATNIEATGSTFIKGDLNISSSLGAQVINVGKGKKMVHSSVDIRTVDSTAQTVCEQILGITIPAKSVITRVVAVVEVDSNLGTQTHNIFIIDQDEHPGDADLTTSHANVSVSTEILGAGASGTRSTDNASGAEDINMGDGVDEKEVWINDDLQWVGASDMQVYIANAGDNGTTNPSAGTIGVYIEYYGID